MRIPRVPVALALALLAGTAHAQQPRVIAVGQSVSGELTATDPVSRTRHAPYNVWTLDGRRGQRVVIDVMSPEFDSYVSLRDESGYVLGSDDDSGEDRNARLRTVLPRDGHYRIVVTAFSDSARGRYTLAVTGWEAPEAPQPGAVAEIRAGESKDGILEPGDSTSDGPFEDHWSFMAGAGQRLRLDMHSSDMDSYLILFGPDGAKIGSDDDGGEGNDASLGFRATAAGRYTVIATTYNENPQSGAYRLTLAEETGNFADPGAMATLSPGETREGRLEIGDPTGRRGPEDRWTFQGRAGQLARLDVISQAFDTYATLRFSETAVDSNDDGGDGTNSRLMTILPSTGTYTLVVSAYGSSNSGGRYSVALQLSEAPAGAGHVESIRPGQRVSGRLEPGDRPRSGGGYQDTWEFDGRSGQDVMLEMHSGDFDSYLELRDADGALIQENDDGAGGNDALIVAHLPRNGRYRIIARSFGEHEATGMYDLSLTLAGDVAQPGRVSQLAADQPILGRLEQGDSVVGDSTWADVFTFRAPRDGDVTIDLRSGDFDAYLLVRDAEGATMTDDDGGEGTNARIAMHVQRGMTYRIYANSYGHDRDHGLYRLSLRYGQ
jgi:hypothetical protein